MMRSGAITSDPTFRYLLPTSEESFRMRVLVTGGYGFVGRAVARALVEHGHDVTVLTSRAGPRIIPDDAVPDTAVVACADLRRAEPIAGLLTSQEFDAVCHLAALTKVRDSFSDPIGYYDVNVAGTVHLLAALDARAARDGRPARLVFASSAAVYGPAEGRLREDRPTRPTNPYGASKLAAEQVIGYQAATGRLQATTLRCFNIAGGYDGHPDPDTTRIVPKTLAVANGDYDHVTVNGDGTALREYTHVLDVAEAFCLALETPHHADAHRSYNLGTGVGISVAEVIAAARSLTGRSIDVEHLPPKPEPPVLLADPSRIRRELGWEAGNSTLDQILADGWTALRHGTAHRARTGQ
jgi:UDP-glucose 4-epimerase